VDFDSTVVGRLFNVGKILNEKECEKRMNHENRKNVYLFIGINREGKVKGMVAAVML